MTSFSWLHLTDLHRGMADQPTLWANIEQQFFEDLTHRHAQTGPWDAIFFTGDMVQGGQKNEFQQLTTTLDRLYRHLDTLGSKPVLLTVPGNHDLVRPPVDGPALLLLHEWSQRPDVRHAFWNTSSSPYRKLVNKAFKHYSTWSEQHPYPRPTGIIKGRLPGDFAVTLTKNDLRIGVIGLNTTFLQLTDGDYTGKLALGMEQIVALLGEHYVDWFKDHTACFLLTHQPPDWLTPEARATLNGEIALPGRFVAHLYGHMHKANTTNVTSGGSPSRIYMQACSLFGLDRYSVGGQHMQRQHGYQIGELRVLGDKGELRLWPRVAAPHLGGHWHLVRDSGFTLQADLGTPPSVVPVRRLKAELSTVRSVSPSPSGKHAQELDLSEVDERSLKDTMVKYGFPQSDIEDLCDEFDLPYDQVRDPDLRQSITKLFRLAHLKGVYRELVQKILGLNSGLRGFL